MPSPPADYIRQRLELAARRSQHREGYRRAAVLIPLLDADGEWEVLLTRRTSDLPHHRGQIAFPGGSLDAGENCVQAAIREANEEIGLDPANVQILGCHDDIWTPSGFIISPVIGVVATGEGLKPNPAEVARLFYVPLSFFADTATAQRQTLMHEGIEREVYFYQWGGETIWGATALMLRNLLGLLEMISDDQQSIA
ncbi:MAG: CoA pyrophosphatase [Bacteroidota bacterium]